MMHKQFVESFLWKAIILMAGLVNAIAMLPQLYSIIITKNIEGISFTMFSLFLFIQICFSVNGFLRKDRILMISLGLSALVSAAIIVSGILIRN